MKQLWWGKGCLAPTSPPLGPPNYHRHSTIFCHILFWDVGQPHKSTWNVSTVSREGSCLPGAPTPPLPSPLSREAAQLFGETGFKSHLWGQVNYFLSLTYKMHIRPPTPLRCCEEDRSRIEGVWLSWNKLLDTESSSMSANLMRWLAILCRVFCRPADPPESKCQGPDLSVDTGADEETVQLELLSRNRT